MTEVVQYAGGWMFDRMMAGWDVTVHVADVGETRPVQILGATVLPLECSLAAAEHGPVPRALAVAGRLVECDDRVRRGVLHTIDEGIAEVRVWGDGLPAEVERRCTPLPHRLSVAARAFKAQALAALESSEQPSLTEVFSGAVVATGYRSVADLTPAV
ncbi:MAG TPA: hypothetical protein VIW24_14725 [Aldersonia sp.]